MKHRTSVNLSRGLFAGAALAVAVGLFGATPAFAAGSFNAYVGDEKMLDVPADAYKSAAAATDRDWSDTAWRGDARSSKVGVAATEADLKNVVLKVSDFKSACGSTISADNVDVSWLRTVNAHEGRNAQGQMRAFPDVIYYGNDGIDIKKGEVKYAWLTINVPASATPGTYKGTVTVSAEGKGEQVLDYTIEVINLVQPTADEANFELQIWQHPFSVSGYYFANSQGPAYGSGPGRGTNAPIDTFMSERHKNLLRGSLEEYAKQGGHDLVANIVEEAWNHQSYFGDTSMVTWIKKADGTWGFDYTLYDKWVKFAEECGVIDPATNLGQIKCYSMISWGGFTYLDEATGQMKPLEGVNPGDANWQEMWREFLVDFHKHSQELGTWDITYISMDERNYDQLKPAVDVVTKVEKEEGFDIKLSSALNVNTDERIKKLSESIDDISVNFDNALNTDAFRKLADERTARGQVTTIYNCTGNYPGNFMISDPGDNYWAMWHTETAHASGFMRWAWDNWTNNMYGDATYQYWEPGDGWFIYPLEKESDLAEHPEGFYSTPRYEMIKEGIRDVSKAKFLKENFPQKAAEVTAATDSLKTPAKGVFSGSAVPQTQQQRLLAHNESERVYQAVNGVARQVAPKPQTHTVSFDLNGGSGSVEAQKVSVGCVAKEPAAPTFEGHTFLGWFDGESKWDFSKGVTKDMTLVARWSKKAMDLKPADKGETPQGEAPQGEAPQGEAGSKPQGKPGTAGDLAQTGDPVALGMVASAAAGVLATGAGIASRRRR